jgi:hypothetical protein
MRIYCSIIYFGRTSDEIIIQMRTSHNLGLRPLYISCIYYLYSSNKNEYERGSAEASDELTCLASSLSERERRRDLLAKLEEGLNVKRVLRLRKAIAESSLLIPQRLFVADFFQYHECPHNTDELKKSLDAVLALQLILLQTELCIGLLVKCLDIPAILGAFEDLDRSEVEIRTHVVPTMSVDLAYHYPDWDLRIGKFDESVRDTVGFLRVADLKRHLFEREFVCVVSHTVRSDALSWSDVFIGFQPTDDVIALRKNARDDVFGVVG